MAAQKNRINLGAGFNKVGRNVVYNVVTKDSFRQFSRLSLCLWAADNN